MPPSSAGCWGGGGAPDGPGALPLDHRESSRSPRNVSWDAPDRQPPRGAGDLRTAGCSSPVPRGHLAPVLAPRLPQERHLPGAPGGLLDARGQFFVARDYLAHQHVAVDPRRPAQNRALRDELRVALAVGEGVAGAPPARLPAEVGRSFHRCDVLAPGLLHLLPGPEESGGQQAPTPCPRPSGPCCRWGQSEPLLGHRPSTRPSLPEQSRLESPPRLTLGQPIRFLPRHPTLDQPPPGASGALWWQSQERRAGDSQVSRLRGRRRQVYGHVWSLFQSLLGPIPAAACPSGFLGSREPLSSHARLFAR